MPLVRFPLLHSTALALLLALAACDCAGGNLKQTKPLLATAPAALDFGTLFVGKTSTLPLTLRNDGGGPLTFASMEIVGDARGAFVLEPGAPSGLAAGTSAELHVRYTAQAPDGADAARLVLTSDSDDGSERVVPLTGTSTSTCPGGTSESACGDGQDNDCDGQVDCADSECAATPACKPVMECPPNAGELRVTNDASASGMPLLLWNGSEFALMWSDGDDQAGGRQDFYFARLSNTRALLSGPTRITTLGKVAHWPSFVWTGSEYGVAWSDTRNGPNDIFFQRLSAQGQPVGGDVAIFSDPALSFPGAIAWNARDQEYAITWGQTPVDDQQRRELTFVRANTQGQLLASPVTVTSSGAAIEYPQLAWTGTFYGALWSDHRDGNMRVYFRRLDANGATLGADTALTPTASLAWGTTLVWNGQSFGAAWTEMQGDKFVAAFARLDAQGTLVGDKVVVGEGGKPSLAWNGQGWALAYSSRRGSDPEQIFLSRLGADGARLGAEQRATCQAAAGLSPSLAWTGSEYGLAWADQRDGNLEVYFKLLPASP